MKTNIKTLFAALLVLNIFYCTDLKGQWGIQEEKAYSLFYTISDKDDVDEYNVYFGNGKTAVEDFFQDSFKNRFSILIHPSRTSLDSSWQKDWNMPEFKSQCWMVASGVAHKLDIISPKKWDSLACEHAYSDSIKTQHLITHELVHVYHGQQNKSPDFSDVKGIDWFVEGLAVYASGQCDSARIAPVKNAILEKNIPQSLDNFWAGKLKYGLSGTLVMYLDAKYGRETLTALLKYNTIDDLLDHLNTTEAVILTEWEDYMLMH